MASKMAIAFVLLAMAATITHARLDLFQMRFSKTQQPINHELIPMQAEKSGFIPYPECIKKCDDCSVCTRIYPIEKALCLCVNYTDHVHQTENKKIPSAIESSVAGTEMTTKLELVVSSDSEWVPYLKCEELCDSCTICTRAAPEFAVCLCVKNTAKHKQPQLPPASEIQTSVVVEEEMKVDSRGKSDLMGSGEMTWAGGIPYPICIKICKECACTRIYPIELATCICLDKDLSKSRLAMK